MKYIQKEKSPIEFEDWKSKKKYTKALLDKKKKLLIEAVEIWKKFTAKSEIRNQVKESLLKEQGFICAYCLQRIDNSDKTTIEHLIPRAIEPSKMFDYDDNLMACCDGGQGENTNRDKEKYPASYPEYCGKHKKNSQIDIHPLQKDCEEKFNYIFNPLNDEVVIEGLTDKATRTIEILNLNTPKLKNLRGNSVKGFILDDLSVHEIDTLINNLSERNQEQQFEPFCVAIVHILQNLKSYRI